MLLTRCSLLVWHLAVFHNVYAFVESTSSAKQTYMRLKRTQNEDNDCDVNKYCGCFTVNLFSHFFFFFLCFLCGFFFLVVHSFTFSEIPYLRIANFDDSHANSYFAFDPIWFAFMSIFCHHLHHFCIHWIHKNPQQSRVFFHLCHRSCVYFLDCFFELRVCT